MNLHSSKLFVVPHESKLGRKKQPDSSNETLVIIFQFLLPRKSPGPSYFETLYQI